MTTSSPKPVALETRWRAACPTLKAFIKRLTASLLAEEDGQGLRQRKRKSADLEKFMRSIEAICCNFAMVALAFGDDADARALAVRLGGYASSASTVYGAHFKHVLALLEGRGLIIVTRGYRYSTFGRAASTIKARPLYWRQAPKPANWDALLLEEIARVVVIRDTADDVEHPPAATSEDWLAGAEADIRAINAHLRDMSIRYSGAQTIPTVEIAARPTIALLTPHHRSVRRIFKATVEHGGRLYGGYWETMPRAERFKHLTINDEPVVNVDYSQLFPRLAYARAGRSPPPGDLYDLTGSEHQLRGWEASAQRIGRKRLLNAMLFATGDLRQWPGGSPLERSEVKLGFAPLKIAEASAAIRARHGAIADEWLGKGRGMELMRTESDLLIAVLLRLISMGVGALPLHDSVLVGRSHTEEVRAVMHDEARRLIGVEIPVKIDAG